ncbi:MAG: MBOAT family protein [Acetatifactor sp.]|nr:MBOAT family protein [Acetatifactor sp.]
MLFNSYTFLIFLPILWFVWSALNRFRLFRAAQLALVIGSFIFYGKEDYKLCFLLAFSIVINYLLHLGLTWKKAGRIVRGLFLAAGLLVNLGLLFYFKYLDFAIENWNRLFGTGFALRKIALPLGISFYTFQQLSFVIDSYKKSMGRYSFLEYCLFVCFFPQLVAGPIVLHQEMIPQLEKAGKSGFAASSNEHYENMLSGMEYFAIGFAKKVLIADSFARICDAGYDNLAQLSSVSALLTILAFTLQIYFDFSGYCDMALGLGRLFDIRLPRNFDSPYKAANIADFWRRWHMTLTRFLTTYLYIPLGGNRRGMVRTCVNIMIVFTVSGLWHGAAWTFVLWGMLHGAAMVIYRVGKKLIDRLPKALVWLGTFLFVNGAWVFFRAEYFGQSLKLFAQAAGGGMQIHPDMISAAWDHTIWKAVLERLVSGQVLQMVGAAALAGWFVLWTVICVKLPSSHEMVERRRRGTTYYIALGTVFATAFLQLSQVSKFIYFNF